MSDLHNLSAPIEDSPEEVVKKQAAIKVSQNEKMKEDIKRIAIEYKQKYLKKLFLSLGIAVTICAVLIWVLSAVFGNKSAPVETAPETTGPKTETPKDTVKYIKFDGHQYYFYVPEGYSFLNRTRNDDLNEIVFSDEKDETIFILQEFEADNDNEATLDSIYSYIETTVPPKENMGVKIGENTFKRRSYSNCIGRESDPELDAQGVQDTMCSAQVTYYSILINGIVVIFETSSSQEILEKTILPTFTKNVITSEGLSEDYIYAKYPNIKNLLQAKLTFGPPFSTQETEGTTEVTWKTAQDFVILMSFDANKNLTSAEGSFENGKYKFPLEDASANRNVEVSVSDVYTLLSNDEGFQRSVGTTGEVLINDSVPNDNFWEVSISGGAQFTVTKDTGKIGR